MNFIFYLFSLTIFENFHIFLKIVTFSGVYYKVMRRQTYFSYSVPIVEVIIVTIVTRNGKIVWKDGSYCWYFRLNLKYLEWPYRELKIAKNGGFCEELLSENDFEAVLATFCCYDHGAKASEAVQKIATDQKEYRKCSSCVIICWIAKIYLSINNSEKWLVTRIPPT